MIEMQGLTLFKLRNQMHVRHNVNAVNSAQSGIENETLWTRISVSCSLCSSLTWQKRGDSNSNTTS